MKKTIFVVLDGLGDEEISDLGNKTPLDFAKTPNLDRKAKEGKLGVLAPTFYGVSPTSEEGHFSLFGYDPQKYDIKRGIVTAKSVGMNIEENDIALRGNLATLEGKEIKDRRAGRINDAERLVESINGIEIEGVKFIVNIALEHRVVVLLKGEGLSSMVTNSDPGYNETGVLEEIKACGNTKEAKFTARILNLFSEKVNSILENHPDNKEREFPANYLLLRGASKDTGTPSFNEKYGVSAGCIAGKDLYRDMGEMMGMKPLSVEGATGTADTNIEGKLKEAVSADFDFVFVHFKATDTLAEDGNFQGKVAFLERFDKELKILDDFKGNLIITSDHSTCSLKKSHCDRDIPFLFHGRDADDRERFTESECENGSVGRIEQAKMIETLDLFGNKEE